MNHEDLVQHLDQFLAIKDIADTCYNGLQVEGSTEVATVALAVDAGRQTFDEAAAQSADFLIVHHGHFWTTSNPSFTGWKKQRLTSLLDNNISLYAAHLPLDRHPEIGNNVQLLQLLGATINAEFYLRDGKNIGWQGTLPKPTPLATITKTLTKQLNTTCTVLDHGPPDISTIAVVTGTGGYQGFYDALAANVDLYITGDTIEIYQTAKDANLNVIFAGHYSTETIGLKALARHLEIKFDLKTIFIEAPTGL